MSPEPVANNQELPLKTALVGKISLIVGLVAFLLLIAGLAQTYFVYRNQDDVKPGQILLMGSTYLGSIILFFSGLILGIAGTCRRRTRKLWSVIGAVVNGIAFLLLIGGVGLMILQFVRARNESAESDDVSTRPIPPAAVAQTVGSRDRLHDGWIRRNLIEAWEKAGVHDPQWDPVGQEILEQYAKILRDSPDAPQREDLGSPARKIVSLNCGDPLLRYLCGRVSEETHFQKKVYAEALTGFITSKYPKVWGWFAAIRQDELLREMNEPSRSVQDTSLSFFQEMLQDGSYTEEESPLLLQDLLSFSDWFEEHGDVVCRYLESAKTVPKWVSLTARGHYYVDQAWKCRGTGWAKSVTKDGWKGMRANLEKASRSFQEAYRLRPDRPEPAAGMINVALGIGKGNARKDMRLWFDRAVTAEFDYLKPYHGLRYGLWPRWYGSDEDILNIGKLCLDTARFDTEVPFEYLQSVYDLKRSSNLPSIVPLLQNEKVYANLERVYGGYIKESRRPQSLPFYYSEWAVISYNAGKWDAARKSLEVIDFKLHPAVTRNWLVDDHMIGQICARSGPAAKDVMEGEIARDERKMEQSLSHFTDALTAAGDDPRATAYIQEQIARLNLEKQMASGEWTFFMPPSDLQGWKVERGQWKVLKDGDLEVQAGFKGLMIHSLASVGMNFEINGEMECISSSNQGFQGGVVFGQPTLNNNKWISFRIKRNSEEGENCCFSTNFYTPFSRAKISVPDKNAFQVRFLNNQLNATVNGQSVIRDVPVSEHMFSNNKPMLVGFGGYYDQNEVVLRFRNVKIRRLKGIPIDVLKTKDGKEYKGIQDVKVFPDGLQCVSESGLMFVDFLDCDQATRRLAEYDPFAAGLARARKDKPMTLTLNSAFRLSQLDEAKKKAIAENKPLGFMMVWDQFFNEEGSPMSDARDGGVSSTIHFYQAFKDSCVLVFVRHEDELQKVPESVRKGFFGPDEGGFAPNLAVVSSDASDYICEIPLGGGRNSTGDARDEVFSENIKIIKAYYLQKVKVSEDKK
jgi:hypothetical protein